jgi:hypothetical protein
MQELSSEAAQALGTLQASAGADIDIYLTASPFRGEGPERIAFSDLDIQAWNIREAEQAELAQFDRLRGEQEYDAAIVLTDGSGYELGRAAGCAPTSRSGWCILKPHPDWLRRPDAGGTARLTGRRQAAERLRASPPTGDDLTASGPPDPGPVDAVVADGSGGEVTTEHH